MSTPFALNLGLNLRTFKTRLGEVRRDLAGLAAVPVRKLGTAMRPAINGLKSMASVAVSARTALLGMVGVGAGIAKGFQQAVGESTALAQANVILRQSQSELAATQKDLRGVADKIGVTYGDVATALFDVASAGFKAKEAFSVVEASAKVAAPSGASIREAFGSIATVMKNFGLSAGEAGDRLVATADQARATLAQIGDAVGHVGPLAAQAGVGFNELAATLAQITTKGVPAAEASTQLIAIIRSFLKPTDEAAGILDKLGIAYGTTAFKSQTLTDKLGILSEAVKKQGLNITDVFSDLEGLKGFGAVTADLKQVAANAAKIGGATGRADKALKDFQASLGPRFHEIVARVANFASRIGEPILRAVVSVIAAVGKLFDKLAPLITPALADIKAVIGSVLEVLAGLRDGMSRAFEGLKELAASIIEPIRSFVEEVGRDVFGQLEASADSLADAFSSVGDTIHSALSRVSVAVRNVLGGAFTHVFNFLRPLVVRSVQAIINIFNEWPVIIEDVADAFGKMASFVSDMFGILIGRSSDTGKVFQGLQATVEYVIAGIEAALTSEVVIKALATIRIAVALVATAFNTLWLVGKMVISGLVGLVGLLAKGLAVVLKALGLVSNSAKQAAAEVDDFADNALRKSAKMSEAAQNRITASWKRARLEIERGVYESQNAGKISRQRRADERARREELRRIREIKTAVTEKAKAEYQGVKDVLSARTEELALTEQQQEKFTEQLSAAQSLLETELQRAATGKDALRAQADYERKLDDIRLAVEDQIDLNEDAARAEGQKTKAAKATLIPQKEQAAIAKRTADAEKSVKDAVEQLVEARVRATKTIEDDLALLARQRNEAEAGAKSEEERGLIRQRYLIEAQKLIEENRRREREAAGEALRQIQERKQSFEDFITSVNRAYDRRMGRDLEVRVDEIGDTFRKQIDNITDQADFSRFQKAFAKGVSEPLDQAAENARKAVVELNRLRSERAQLYRSEGQGSATKSIEREVFAAGQRLMEAEKRYNELKGRVAGIQAVFQEKLLQKQKELAAGERQLAEQKRLAAEKDTADRGGVSGEIDTAEARKRLRKAEESAGKAEDAAKSAEAAAGVTAKASAKLAQTVKAVAGPWKENLQALADRVERIAASVAALLQSTSIFPRVAVGLDSLLEGQRAFGDSVNLFAETVAEKIGEAANGFASHKRLIDGLTERLKRIELSRVADDGKGMAVLGF